MAISKKWIFNLVTGIFILFFGIYGILQILVFMKMIGIIIVVMITVYGIKQIAAIFE